MSEACIEAKEAASMLSSLTDIPVNSEGDTAVTDRGNIRAARSLLASVTRVLVITDMVVVKRLINAARKVWLFFNALLVYLIFNINCPIYVHKTLHDIANPAYVNIYLAATFRFAPADTRLHTQIKRVNIFCVS